MDKKKPYTSKDQWINIGISFLIATAANIIVGMILGSEIAHYIYLILVAYWVFIEVKRFHDANKSGWLALLNLVPGIGTFATLIIAGVLKSDYNNNKWMSR